MLFEQKEESSSQSQGATDPWFAAAQAAFIARQYRDVITRCQSQLEQNPNHLTALKLLGDAAFALSDEWTAIASYQRVLELDPSGGTLVCPVPATTTERTRTITLRRAHETASAAAERPVPLYSETIGDLYLSQGHPRLAAEVFRKLAAERNDERLRKKLAAIEADLRQSK